MSSRYCRDSGKYGSGKEHRFAYSLRWDVSRTLAFLLFAICLLTVVVKSLAADVRNGRWTISKSKEPDKIDFSLIEHHRGGDSSSESNWGTASFPGVDFSKSGLQDVRFTISRDAGKIECEGFLNNEEGAETFHFQPDPNYAREMQALGFLVDEEKQYDMAVQDVSLEFAREMRDERLTSLDTDKLIAFRIHGGSRFYR